jgi:hypothetical protein
VSENSTVLSCPHCAAPLDAQRVLSDPWREHAHGARVFGERPKAGQALRYVLSCGNCLAAHEVRLGPDTHLQTLATSERMLGLARAIEELRNPWDLVEDMLVEPFQAELLGTPEVFARLQPALGGFVRLLRKTRVDLRPDPPDLSVPVGPRNVFSPEKLTQGPVLPLAFKLFPVGLRNGLLVVRPDRIRSSDGRQLPLLAVPLDWVRRQPDVRLDPEFFVPALPSGARIVHAVMVESESEPEPVVPERVKAPPQRPRDPFDLPEPAGLIAQVEKMSAPETSVPTPVQTARSRLIDGHLDPQVMSGWNEDPSDPDSSWAARPQQSTELAEGFAALLSENLGAPIERFTDPDTRLALTVHVYATPDHPKCVTLISDGMRRYKMPVVGVDTPRRVELCWTLNRDLIQGIGSWPVQLFIRLARMPFASRSATWPGDVLGPLRPGFGETGFKDALLLTPTLLPAALRAPLTSVGRTDLLAVWPVSRAHAILAEQGAAQDVLAKLEAQCRSEAFAQGG